MDELGEIRGAVGTWRGEEAALKGGPNCVDSRRGIRGAQMASVVAVIITPRDPVSLLGKVEEDA